MKIKRVTGIIKQVIDISPTAKEIFITLSEQTDFIPGSFFNVFIEIDGQKVRRAFSVSSSSNDQNNITFTVRLSPKGTMTPLFWKKDMVGETLELMGPLGLNTVDKMTKNKIYLFAFGVGVGVVKSVADYFSNQKNNQSLTIITGSRTEDEILYENYFIELSEKFKNISVHHVISRAQENSKYPKGYIQDHINELDFNNSDVFVCGQESACDDLVELIKAKQPVNVTYLIEGFH